MIRQILEAVSITVIPLIVAGFIFYAAKKKVPVYESFVSGAKGGFDVAIKIIPYLVAMLVAIGIFRASGAMDILVGLLAPIGHLIGMPPEVLPIALLRPLSGSGSLGLMSDIMKKYGPDSFIGVLVSTMYGSSETTFYVIAVYFGAVNISRTRHAVAAGLIADVVGMIGALLICKILF
ncbi:MAG: spore maturation protein [Candidatus Kryptoniota bacterium]